MEAVQDHSTIDDYIGGRVLMAIARFIPADGSEGWVSYRVLADIAKCDKDTVGTWVANIEKMGEISTRKVGKGRGTKIYYTLNLPFDKPKHKGDDRDNTKNNVPTHQTSDGTIEKELLEKLLSQLSQNNELLSQLLSQNVPTHQTSDGTETNKPLETIDNAASQRGGDEKPHTKLMRLYQTALGYKIPNGGKEAAGAKRILKQYSPEDAIGCYRYLKSDPFWQGKHLSLQTVYEQIGAWQNAGKPESKGGGPQNHNPQNNGTITATSNGQRVVKARWKPT